MKIIISFMLSVLFHCSTNYKNIQRYTNSILALTTQYTQCLLDATAVYHTLV